MATKPRADLESEAALKAVEEALNFDLSGEDESEDTFAELERSIQAATNDLKQSDMSADAIDGAEANNSGQSQPSDPTPPGLQNGNAPENNQTRENAEYSAANDDRRNTVANLVYGLQRKPSTAALWFAAIFSLIWLAVYIFVLRTVEPALFSSPQTLLQSVAQPKTLLYLGGAFIPVFLIWAFATLIRRAQEMRFAARSMTEAAIRLMQPEAVATESLTTVGRAIRREVFAINDSMEQALARAGELETIVQNEVLNLERSYSDSEIKLSNLVTDLGAEREMVISHADRLRESISISHVGLINELENASGQIQQAIEQASNLVNSNLENASGSVNASLIEAGNEIVARLANSGTELDQHIKSGTQHLERVFSSHGDTLVDQINLAGSTAANLLETQSIQLRDQGDAITQQIENTIGIRISDFSSRLNETGETLQTLLDNKLNTLDDTLSIKGNAFVDALGMGTTALDKVLSERTNVISETLAGRLSTFGQSMTGHVDSVVDELKRRHSALEQSTVRIEETILERSTSMLEGLDKRNSEFSNIYIEGETTIRAAMESGIAEVISKAAEIKAQIDSQNQRLVDSLEGGLSNIVSKGEEISAKFDGQSAQLVDGMDEKSRTLLVGLDQRIHSLASGVEENAALLRTLLAEKTDIILSGITSRSGELLSGLDERSTGFADGLEERVTQMRDAVDGGALKLLDAVDAGKRIFEASINQKSSEIGTIIQSGEKSFSEIVEGKYGLFSKILDEKRDAISADLDGLINLTAETIDQKAAAMSGILTDRAKLINESLGSGLTDSQRLLEHKTKEFNEMLSHRSQELSTILDEQAKPLIDAIKNQGNDVSIQLGAVHEVVSNDVGSLLAKLGTASEALASLITKSSRELSKIESSITVQAEGMAQSVANASADFQASTALAETTQSNLDSTAKNMLANIGSIAERFDHHGQLLQQATAILENAQRDFSTTLEDRSGTLDTLAQGLVSRSSEIENSMLTFSSLLTKTMEETTRRTRALGQNVTEEIRNAMEETNARFSASLEAMRQAAQDVQRDLEETRTQMRKGVMELPEETRQSADAMRKVVADQIAALRDLSEIVAKSGKALDAAPAAVNQQRYATAAPSFSTVAANPTPPVAAAPRQTTSPQQRVATPRPQPSQPSAAPAFGQPTGRPPTGQTSQRSPTAQTRAQDSGGDNTGWVSELLRRASSEDQPSAPRPVQNGARSPLQMVESLNSISMDIARQIDHEASIELWDRYQRGERNVFTRRLYTLKGQQTFDEIRMKYSRDPEFRDAVDRYVEDFELLLEDVAKNDRENMMVQTYLTSDTGKVYTMLAHASGRFAD